MAERKILAHSRKRGETYFQSALQRDPRKKILQYVNEVQFEIIKTNLKDTYIGRKLQKYYKMGSLHDVKYIIKKRLRLWSISW